MPAPKTDDKPQVEQAAEPELTPDQVGYCHQDDCPQVGVEVALWKNLDVVPVLCQCGHLLSPVRPGEDVESDPV